MMRTSLIISFIISMIIAGATGISFIILLIVAGATGTPLRSDGEAPQKELFIIDTDGGPDDALAILLAVSPSFRNQVEVLGVTCVSGNVEVNEVVKNVLITLKLANRSDIPVFKGASDALIPFDYSEFPYLQRYFFTEDGIGGQQHLYPLKESEIQAVLERGDAVQWIGKTILQHPPQTITLVAIAPLTNVAFALRLYPEIGTRLKKLVIQGGSLQGRGYLRLAATFNFALDPEAAHVCLDNFNTSVSVVPSDTTSSSYFTYDWYNQTVSVTTPKAHFIQQIYASAIEILKSQGTRGFYAGDWIAMAVAIEPPGINLTSISHYMPVELLGKTTRGEMVVDWYDLLSGPGGKRKIRAVTGLNLTKLQDLFVETLI